jgi:methylated-DNA-protein-cysteine methyltransferase related protein
VTHGCTHHFQPRPLGDASSTHAAQGGNKGLCRPFTAMPKSKAFTHIRAEVLRLIALIPEGKFTTYGSLATHMNIVPLHVASVLGNLTPEEAEALPWHRVTASDGRISTAMPPRSARKQRARLKAEGLTINKSGFIQDADAHYYYPGPRRSIRWSEQG